MIHPILNDAYVKLTAAQAQHYIKEGISWSEVYTHGGAYFVPLKYLFTTQKGYYHGTHEGDIY